MPTETPTEALRMKIEQAVAHGVDLDDVEHELLDPAHLSQEDKDALWLYAFGRSDYLHRRYYSLADDR